MKRTSGALSPRMKRALITLLVLWVVYLVGVNWFVNSDLLTKIVAKNPERTKVGWEKAWTVVPGLVHARRFNLWKHTRGIEWNLRVDKGRVLVNLLALPFGTFQALTAKASGVDFELGRADTVLPRKNKTKPGFRVWFVRAAANDVRAVKVGDFELEGPLKVRGGFDSQTRGPLRLPRTRVKVKSGVLRIGDVDLARDLKIDARVAIDRHVPREHKDTGIIPFVSGRLEVAGDVQDLAFLNELVRTTNHVEFAGGSGWIDADIRFNRGVIEPDSSLVSEEATYTVDYLDYTATGTGRIRAFKAADSAEDELLHLELADFDLARRGEEKPHISGNHLTLSVRRAGGVMIPRDPDMPSPDLVVDLQKSEVPDFRVYNRNLPANGSMHVVSGSGTVEGHIEILESSREGRADIRLTGDDLVLDFKGKRVVGDLESVTKARLVDPENPTWDPSGTRVEFRNAGAYVEGSNTDVPADWWGAIEITKGGIRFRPDVEASVELEIDADSAQPVFALFAKTQKRAEMMDRRIKTNDLSGSGKIEVDQGMIALTDVEIEGGQAGIRADLCIEHGLLSGLIHVKYGVLAAAAELEGQKETLHVTSPKKWFERNHELFRCGN
jgi:hypothetical protein